jgi:hypothetical protein
MNNSIEGTLSIWAALLVLLTAMLDPRISVALSVIFLAALIVYEFAFVSRNQPS